MSTALDDSPANPLEREAELSPDERDAAFTKMVARLSKLSVEKHFDAYADIDWDSDEMAIDPADPRWELWSVDPLGATEWYRDLPADARARLGLYRVAAAMKTGWHFENLLQRGLLQYSFALPNGAPEFRYVHHEVIEESQHTLMFQELVNRSGLPVRGLGRTYRILAALFVVPLSRVAPALFFFFVLGGEDPVDHLQRAQLGTDRGHPLARRIMRIHVTEEARHLSFARHYLRREVPALPWFRRAGLSLIVPILLGVMTRLMLVPPRDLTTACNVPRSVIRDAFRSPAGRELLRDSVAKPRKLCRELGLLNPVAVALWKIAGIWDAGAEPTDRSGTRSGRATIGA